MIMPETIIKTLYDKGVNCRFLGEKVEELNKRQLIAALGAAQEKYVNLEKIIEGPFFPIGKNG